MKNIVTALGLLLLCGLQLKAQYIPEQYISAALENNLVLKEKKLSLEKSLVALKEARTLFLPTTWFEGQYTLAQGGRSIEFPVGDLLNPVYKSLNQLTGSSFPVISNVSEQFLPNNFYDVRIKTTMPLINPDIRINKEIRQHQASLQQNEVDIYKRTLVKEIRQAYYNYLVSGNAVAIYQSALAIVNQNLKVNESLLKNGKGLPAYVSRAESEVKQVTSQLQHALNEQRNAKAYFNFLLNRPFTDSIIVIEPALDESRLPLANYTADNIASREELKSLDIARNINQHMLKKDRSFRTPRLNAFLDLASQGYDFKVNNRSFFYLGGLQLQVPIFTGKRNLYRIQQTTLEGEAIRTNAAQVKQQLELAAFVSHNSIVTAYNNYRASIKQQEAATQYFKLIDRGFREGVNSFIEFLDARNQLTTAGLQAIINKYKVFNALAEYERQTAAYQFK